MPAASTLKPVFYTRGDTGYMQQSDGTNDNSVLGWQGGVVYRLLAAGTALTGSSTETALGSFSIDASTLKAGTVVKIRYQGIATATNSTDTLTIKTYIGGLSGTALLTSSATDATNNDIFEGEVTLVVRTAGASGTFVAVGGHTKVEGASGTATRVSAITASTTIDTTVAQVVAVSGQWSTTSGSNSCRLDILTVEIY